MAPHVVDSSTAAGEVQNVGKENIVPDPGAPSGASTERCQMKAASTLRELVPAAPFPDGFVQLREWQVQCHCRALAGRALEIDAPTV